MNDLISRQALAEHKYTIKECEVMGEAGAYRVGWNDAIDAIIDNAPSAEPEIIRCKDCKYQDENWRRVSVRWLPCMDVRTGSNWFCGSAERRTNE